MSEKAKDPETIKQNISHKPIDCEMLNRLTEDFEKRFTLKQELSTGQAFWLHISYPTIESSLPPIRVEVPIELPKRSESYEKCLNFDVNFSISKQEYNDLLNKYLQLEKHCISLEVSMQLKQEVFQNDESCVCQNAPEIPEYFEKNDLKAQLKDKDTTIRKLKDNIKSLRKNNKEEIVDHNRYDLATVNSELENSVAKSLSENERLCKEINLVKQVVQIILWYLDSGCSKHITGNRSQLINFVSKFFGTVRFRNDQIARIMGYGDYQLGNVVISRVYYVEGLEHKLFSVGQFCDMDLEVAFQKNTCFIRDLEGVDQNSGSRDTNLYTITLDDMLKSSLICLLSKASKTKSPMIKNKKLDEDIQGKPIDTTLYRGMIASLMYLTASRPDLIYVVCLSYADADHAGCQDTRCSTSGITQFLGDKLVSWSSKKQKSIAISSTKIPMYYSNKSAIALCCNNSQHSRANHIDVRYHFIKEHVDNGIMELYFIWTEYQLADIFTKPFPQERFYFLIDKLDSRLTKKKRFKLTLEVFRDILQICLRSKDQDFDALPSEEDTVSFLRKLGYTRVVNLLNDVVTNQMHQPWRTFVALINISLSGKTTEASHKYGVILPECLTSPQMKESKPYKTYLGYVTRTVPPKVARKFKKVSPSKKDSIPVPADEEPVQKGKRVKRPGKKSSTTPTTGIVIKEPPVETQSKSKEKVDVTHGKGINLLSEVALMEESQMKEVRKKSLRYFHKSHPSGSGSVAENPPSVEKITPPVINEGTGDKPGVLDVTKDDSTESESKSWGNDDDNINDEEGSEQENDSEEHELDSEQDTYGSESNSKSDQQDDDDDDEVKDDDKDDDDNEDCRSKLK
uniref:Retrovirus-related Pol polyprotein from transposon TNT 1-94 n=1 Tax=Tanacetum cinerariifolium TaxID=118510 RepID=A0A6L2KW82_TANCI|nr:retrovirus-related Pol polyprotein from transposon TNT 1-94 [Tanacetum cinerariifolium]